MLQLTYLIGVPGAGKSTAMRLALALLDWEVDFMVDRPFAHVRYTNGATYIGRQDGAFPGTDRLSMSVSPVVSEHLRSASGLWFGEGDRLASGKFLDSLTCSVELVLLDVSPATALSRGATRAADIGAQPQDPTWWKGRATKVQNLAQRFNHTLIDGERPMDDVATDLAEILRRGLPD